MQRGGLEWAYRLGSEPRRLWRRYLFGNAAFVVAALKNRPDKGVSSSWCTWNRHDVLWASLSGSGSIPRTADVAFDNSP